MSETSRVLDVRRLGRTDYADAYELQKGLVDARLREEVPDTLVLTEHEPVVTVGRGSEPSAVAGVQHPVFEVERGGEATWHGPGQLVAYPILHLGEGRRDLHRYLRDLEEVVIGVLSEFEVEGSRKPGWTGVWIGERKVCSIGVAVRRWVTWHGLALNVHTAPDAFAGFHPCGLAPDVMTSLAEHAAVPPGNLLVEVLAVKHLCRVFGYELPEPARPAGGGGKDLPDLPLFPG